VTSIVVDSAVWVDHLHAPISALNDMVDNSIVLTHPMVIGEISLGSIKRRTEVLKLLKGLPSAEIALHEEVLAMVESRRLYGRGLSLVDVHLLASTVLTTGARLWTHDKQLKRAADELGVAFAAP
jgi:hypothetical protein